MEQILIIRETIVQFFKRYEAFILPIAKFLLGLFIFSVIQNIGHVHESLQPFTEMLSPTLLIFLFALLFTVMPMNLGWILIIAGVTIQFSANIEVAASVFLFLLFIFLFYARMSPKESILILFTMLAFHFNVPYLVPLIVGLYFSVTAIIPITIGVFVYAQIPVLDWLMEGESLGSIGGVEEAFEGITEAFSVVYEALIRSITNTHDWLFTAVIFALVVVLVHFVSRLSIDFAKEVSIALGCVMNIFGFIVSIMIEDANVNIGVVIVSTILCGLIAEIIRLFDSVLDYQRAESVQFEDDNNFYHVRIVPKVVLTKPKRVIKRIRSDSDDEYFEGDPEADRGPHPANIDNPATDKRARPTSPIATSRPYERTARRPRPVQRASDNMPELEPPQRRVRTAPRLRENENPPVRTRDSDTQS